MNENVYIAHKKLPHKTLRVHSARYTQCIHVSSRKLKLPKDTHTKRYKQLLPPPPFPKVELYIAVKCKNIYRVTNNDNRKRMCRKRICRCFNVQLFIYFLFFYFLLFTLACLVCGFSSSFGLSQSVQTVSLSPSGRSVSVQCIVCNIIARFEVSSQVIAMYCAVWKCREILCNFTENVTFGSNSVQLD